METFNTNTEITIYRDGELDRMDYMQKQAKRFISAVGHIAYKGLEVVATNIDEALADAGAYEGISLTRR